MKYLLLIVITTGCSHYTTTKLNSKQVMVNDTITGFGFSSSTVYTCSLDSKGLITDCQDNRAEGRLLYMDKRDRIEWHRFEAARIERGE